MNSQLPKQRPMLQTMKKLNLMKTKKKSPLTPTKCKKLRLIMNTIRLKSTRPSQRAPLQMRLN